MSCQIELTEDEYKEAQQAIIQGVSMMLCGLGVRVIACSMAPGELVYFGQQPYVSYQAEISRVMA